jgi:hypothetical protein
MNKRGSSFKAEELGGSLFDDLSEAQILALPALAGMLVETVYNLIESGELVHQEGEIVVKCEVKNDK